jgi:hypothetical protein
LKHLEISKSTFKSILFSKLFINGPEQKILIRYQSELDLISIESNYDAKINEINHKIEKKIAIKGMLF